MARGYYGYSIDPSDLQQLGGPAYNPYSSAPDFGAAARSLFNYYLALKRQKKQEAIEAEERMGKSRLQEAQAGLYEAEAEKYRRPEMPDIPEFVQKVGWIMKNVPGMADKPLEAYKAALSPGGIGDIQEYINKLIAQQKITGAPTAEEAAKGREDVRKGKILDRQKELTDTAYRYYENKITELTDSLGPLNKRLDALSKGIPALTAGERSKIQDKINSIQEQKNKLRRAQDEISRLAASREEWTASEQFDLNRIMRSRDNISRLGIDYILRPTGTAQSTQPESPTLPTEETIPPDVLRAAKEARPDLSDEEIIRRWRARKR